jgi:hypothetical protein
LTVPVAEINRYAKPWLITYVDDAGPAAPEQRVAALFDVADTIAGTLEGYGGVTRACITYRDEPYAEVHRAEQARRVTVHGADTPSELAIEREFRRGASPGWDMQLWSLAP